MTNDEREVPMLTHFWRKPKPSIDLSAIMADITVYDFVDGVEVHRQPAFPIAKLAYTMSTIPPLFNKLAAVGKATGAQFTEFIKAFEAMK
jgi:hypothetical protein